uniref:Stum, mechanosensory transduction mediator homolog n=1 Tax=Macaca mulatta TaxID=9544 RepID=A0A1D5QH57_MACMU
MEPSHKDAETAAAAAAVAAADPRGASSSSGVVVQVREKKGPLRAAIPYMPFPVAVICLFLNTFVPGLGTFVSAFTVLCGARTDLPDRHVCCVFWLNIAAALIQILTAIVMVGWIMSIFWGMDMVILATSSQATRSRASHSSCEPTGAAGEIQGGPVRAAPGSFGHKDLYMFSSAIFWTGGGKGVFLKILFILKTHLLFSAGCEACQPLPLRKALWAQAPEHQRAGWR